MYIYYINEPRPYALWSESMKTLSCSEHCKLSGKLTIQVSRMNKLQLKCIFVKINSNVRGQQVGWKLFFHDITNENLNWNSMSIWSN